MIWILSLVSSLSNSQPLFIKNEITDPLIAEQGVDILQCVATKTGRPWDLVDTFAKDHLDRVVFSQEAQELKITASKGSQKISPSNCRELSLFFGNTKEIQLFPDAVPTKMPNSPNLPADWPKEEKNFLAKNWPWLAASGLALGVILLMSYPKPHKTNTYIEYQ